MKSIYKIKFIVFIGLLGVLFSACEDDEAISAGNSDPLSKEIVNIEATITSDVTITGEGNRVDFTATLPRTFTTDVTVTALARLDNGATSTGEVEIAAGETSGDGFLFLAPDDNVVSGPTLDGVQDAATISLTGILLDELEPNTTYTISSNELLLDLYPYTETRGGGLAIAVDWENYNQFDLDMQVINREFTAIFETSASGSRIESFLFQSAARADGIYDIYLRNYSTSPSENLNFRLLFTFQDGTVQVLDGFLPAGSPAGGARIPVATFEKFTDPEEGAIYINLGLL
ncbi:MAG: hypothetical protein CL883_05375 [Dehalococcoidia bacterium]|nr:hypothetical protein [Dehalococcoidia bacterium]